MSVSDDFVLGLNEASEKISGNRRRNKLNGGYSAEFIDGRGGNDKLHGGFGNDTLVGGSGTDVLKGDDGNDLLVGASGNDRLEGSYNRDALSGGVGSDSLNGGEGNDVLFGGDGNDTLRGGYGYDKLSGGNGDDTLAGESAADELLGGTGNDELYGGGGSDTYIFRAGDGADIVLDEERLSADKDVFNFNDIDAADQLWFSRNDDSLMVNVVGTDDQVEVQDWYHSDNLYKIEEIIINGAAITDSGVEALVQAMASFDVPVGIGRVVSDDAKQQLEPILAQHWSA